MTMKMPELIEGSVSSLGFTVRPGEGLWFSSQQLTLEFIITLALNQQ